VGLDRLRSCAPVAAVLVLAGCDDGRPERLLNGQAAAEFRPVEDSVITQTRTLRAGFLDRRFRLCLNPGDRPAFPADTLVVERVGVLGESLTFLDRAGRHLYACDGGVDPVGERRQPWCGVAVGRLLNGSLLDPRLDILCRDSKGKPLAYAWVVPVAGSHWIGVDQGSYTELYEVAANLPVRIASTRGVDRAHSRATFEVTHYAVDGKELARGKLEAVVAG
jgi:hypothetical protein